MARKDVEKFLYKTLKAITGSDENSKIYERYLKKMSDKQLEQWLIRCQKGDDKISVVVNSTNAKKVGVETIIKEGKKIGKSFFTKVRYKEPDGKEYISPIPVNVILLPCRRMSQILDKGQSVSKDDSQTDKLTGQPISDSRSASISIHEVNVLSGLGLTSSLAELDKYRGGDLGGYNALKASMAAKGSASQVELNRYTTGVLSSKTTYLYLLGKHIGTNL